ncbi:MAG: gliding motility-associated C-terminal domain-containing protein [Muribaculaceae bacterium]
MKRFIFLLPLLLFTSVVYSQVVFENSAYPVFVETPVASTGLNNIYVIYNVDGVTLSYTSVNENNTVKWYKYGSQGGGYAEEITGVQHDGAVTKLSNIIKNSGYIIEDGNQRKYFWVVNYADYFLDLGAIRFDAEQDCNVTLLNVEGYGPDIIYYTINGQQKVLSRELTLTYNTLEWDSEGVIYKNIELQERYDSFKSSLATTAPFVNTMFTLSGDKFLKYWNKQESITSDEYFTNAVSVNATAVQSPRDANNEVKGDVGGLGGSAPADIEFTSYFTDAVIHKEWQFSNDSEFKNILYRYNEETLNYSFQEAGTFYVRFVGSNSSGNCEATSETFTVSIGDSSIECPNAFSPQSSEGTNDEWKISYKSIVSFKCWIFNRWGIQVCNFDNPSIGWDGKYNGKYVDAGVYFYVIEAKGADGKNYKLKGDINIINLKK